MPENPKHHEQIAYFRYAVIAPLLTDEVGQTLKERIHQQAQRIWVRPDGKVKRLCFGTIESWLYAYKNGGIEALKDHPRKDAGSFRGIDKELADKLNRIMRDHPKLVPPQFFS